MVTLKPHDRFACVIASGLVTRPYIIAQRSQKTLCFKKMIGWGGVWNRGAGSRLREHSSSRHNGRRSGGCGGG